MVECIDYCKIFKEGEESLTNCVAKFLNRISVLDKRISYFINEEDHNTNEQNKRFLSELDYYNDECINAFTELRDEYKEISKEPDEASVILSGEYYKDVSLEIYSLWHAYKNAKVHALMIMLKFSDSLNKSLSIEKDLLALVDSND